MLLGSAKQPLAGKRGRWPRGGVASVVVDILRAASGPLTLDQLGTTLAEQWPLPQGWKARIASALRDHQAICRIAPNTYDLFERRISGAHLLHTLTDAEVNIGVVLADPDLDDLVVWWQARTAGDGHDVHCLDAAGNEIHTTLVHVSGPQPASQAGLYPELGERIYRILAGLSDWLRATGARPGDDLCITPEPPDARRFRLTLRRDGAPVTGDRTSYETKGEPRDAALAEAALAILQASRSILHPRVLLHRLAGKMDLRSGPPVHFPIFVLGRDPRFTFDGTFYALRALAEEESRRTIASPYPRPEDYPADWPHRDLKEEIFRQLRSILPPNDAMEAVDAVIQRQLNALNPEALELASRARAAMWDLLQSRSRLLNPPARAGTRQTGAHVIRGPWPGSR